MVDSLHHLIGLLFFDIPLLHYINFILILELQQFYFFNLRSPIILSLIAGDIYLSLRSSSSFASELFCGKVFETLVILSAILFPNKSPVASAVF